MQAVSSFEAEQFCYFKGFALTKDSHDCWNLISVLGCHPQRASNALLGRETTQPVPVAIGMPQCSQTNQRECCKNGKKNTHSHQPILNREVQYTFNEDCGLQTKLMGILAEQDSSKAPVHICCLCKGQLCVDAFYRYTSRPAKLQPYPDFKYSMLLSVALSLPFVDHLHH